MRNANLVRLGKMPPDGSRDLLHAKIISSSAINGAVRYKYMIQLGYWDMTASPSTGGTWVAKPSSLTYPAFNSAEDLNTFVATTGAIGTGNTNVTRADGTVNGGSCKMVALPNGGYCVVKYRGMDTTGQKYYTIINFANSAQ